MKDELSVRNARKSESKEIGLLMIAAYSDLDGFPSEEEQPQYYDMLRNIFEWSQRPNTELLVAQSPDKEIMGAVVYFSDMSQYGSGGTATQEKNASGFRLLAVAPDHQSKGVAKQLTLACIDKAKRSGNQKLIIHTTKAMEVAWKMYERLGFRRAEDLDFMQGDLPVFGFRLALV